MSKINDLKKKIDKDTRLTIFQKKVYRTILEIPKGKIRSYKWVAIRSGKPNGARAVGNALNKNPFAPEVPCHRVVRSDGTLGGYSRGVSKKRDILRKEGVKM